MAWTKTQRKAIARKSRAAGYYKSTTIPTRLWVKCPECQEEVDCQDHAYGQSDIRKIDAGMDDHLLRYCGQD